MNQSSSLFVSVVMPVYNCDKYIREAIGSILNQTYRNFEFIIINDGSTDNSSNIIKYYANKDCRIKIINQSNSGIVRALNRGLFEAKSEWIFRMDGDDISLPHRFEIQIETIKKNSSLVLVGGNCQQINHDGNYLKTSKYPSKNNRLVQILENEKSFFPHSSACFHRDAVMKIGGYRERFRHAEDIDLWLRMIDEGEFACCKDVVLKLRKHKENISNFHSGRIQQIITIAAQICYFRRKWEISEPAQFTEEHWKQFLKWVEKNMYNKGYFQQKQEWQMVRNIWYNNVKENKLKKTYLILKKLLQEQIAWKVFYSRFKKENLALKLSKESIDIFHLEPDIKKLANM